MDPNPYESPQTPPEPPRGPSPFAGFLPKITVVELLVVIAIIGILIGLLTPAVSSSPRHRLRLKYQQDLQSAP